MAGRLEYQLIIFDWDGTLMDSSKKIVRCFAAAASDLGIPAADADKVKSYIGLGLVEALVRLYPGQEIATINRLASRYRQHWWHIDETPMPVFAGVEPGLIDLNNAGYLLAVATGKSRSGLNHALETTDLQKRFVYSRCADEARSKPHPQMLLDILAYTGLDNTACIMVGDTTFDLDMAKNANMAGLGVGYGCHARERLAPLSIDAVVDDFSQLTAYFIR